MEELTNPTGRAASIEPNDATMGSPRPTVWGFWAATGIAVLILATMFGVGIVAVLAKVLPRLLSGAPQDAVEYANSLAMDGDFIAVTNTIAYLPAFMVMWAFVALRRNTSFRNYLALVTARARSVIICVVGIIIYCGFSDLFSVLAGKPIVPDVVLDVYRTANHPAALFAVIVVAAPLFEEFLFRGFLYPSYARSLGTPAAIFLTALFWTLLHFQYGIDGLTFIFGGGIILGLARYKTGSILPCIIMHVTINFLAFAETVYFA